MKLIYMQRTIDEMHRRDPNSLNELAVYGAPQVMERDENNDALEKYYKYLIEVQDQE